MVNTRFLFFIDFSVLLIDSASKPNKAKIYKILFQFIPSIFILVETKCKEYFKIGGRNPRNSWIFPKHSYFGFAGSKSLDKSEYLSQYDTGSNENTTLLLGIW